MFTYNEKQKYIINRALENIHDSYAPQVYQFSGRAGTGKSVVLNAIADMSGIPRNRIAAMAYVGQAAIIMRLKGFPNSRTIHSWMYQPYDTPILDRNGNPVIDPILGTPILGVQFKKVPHLPDIDLIIIDEAGTVPMHMRKDIEGYGIKIVAAGDLGQLPPIEDEPAFLYNQGPIDELDQIMRQKSGSAILYLADRASKGLPIHTGYYGDCLVVYDDEITDDMIMACDMTICGTNKTRDMYNNHIRHDILGIYSDAPLCGEQLICRKNNWDSEIDGVSLTNGLCGRVCSPIDGTDIRTKGTFKMNFSPNLFNMVFRDIDVNLHYMNASKEERERMKKNKYTQGNLFEYGYALTTHLSQGSQAHSVLYIQEYLSPEINNRLWYTGITRATDCLIYAIHRRKYF